MQLPLVVSQVTHDDGLISVEFRVENGSVEAVFRIEDAGRIPLSSWKAASRPGEGASLALTTDRGYSGEISIDVAEEVVTFVSGQCGDDVGGSLKITLARSLCQDALGNAFASIASYADMRD